MILLVKGDLTVDGTIHVDKCAPLANDSEELAAQERHVALCGNLTGGKGGDGGGAVNNLPGAAITAKGTGGLGFTFGGGFGGGGAAIGSPTGPKYDAGNGDPRPPAGTTIPYPSSSSQNNQYGAGGSASYNFMGPATVGGGGPGGGGAYGVGNIPGSAGDAIGGGALWLFVQGKVRVNSEAKISSRGGNGGTTSGRYDGPTYYGYPGSGGGGGGGIICLVHTGNIVNQGEVSAAGGVSPTPSGTNGDFAKGQDGFPGTVLITNISDLLATRVQQAFTALNILGVKT